MLLQGFMNVTKNQHYIQARLLDQFTNENGMIFEFLVDNVNKEPYPCRPDNAMSASFIYEDTSILKINAIENAFADGIDAKLPKIVKDVIEQIKVVEKEGGELSAVRNTISQSLSLFLIGYYKSGALLEEFSSDNDQEKKKLMLRKILDIDYINFLANAINSFYRFAVIRSDDDFLISDQYVSTVALKIKSNFVEMSNRNMGLKETAILIPLSSEYYVIYWHTDFNFIFQEQKINIVRGKIIENINRVIVNNAYKKCVGKKIDACKSMQKKYNYNSTSVIFAKDFYFIKKKEVFWNEQEMTFWKSFKNHEPPDKFIEKRNNPCSCRSGKKFKKCHYGYEHWWNCLVQTFDCKYPFISISKYINDYCIKGIPIIEGPIDQR